MKKLSLLGGIAAALLLALPAQAEVKVALDTPPDLEKAGSYVWAHTFTEALKKAGVEAKEYPRNALGEEAERLDQVSQGLLEVSMSDVKSAGKVDKLVFGVYLPYLFEGLTHLDKAVESAGLLDRINASIEKSGLRVLAFTALGPPAGIFNTKKPIKTVADMADLRMRALDENQIALYKAWGTTGTIVSWSEVPNALQTGVADGYLNMVFVPLMFGHTDFIKFFTDAKISPSVRLALASNDWYEGLSAKDRAAVDAAVAEATRVNREWLEKRGAKMMAAAKAAGIKVETLSASARAEFVERSRRIWASGVLSAAQAKVWIDAADKTR